MSLNTAPLSFRRAAWALGLAGLLPFIALSWLSWRASPWAHTMLLQYGAIILSFVGALHWGLALGKQKPSVLALVWSATRFSGDVVGLEPVSGVGLGFHLVRSRTV
jgi:Protein of unknown function (DUF3429)